MAVVFSSSQIVSNKPKKLSTADLFPFKSADFALVGVPLLNLNTTSNSVSRRCVLLTNDRSERQ